MPDMKFSWLLKKGEVQDKELLGKEGKPEAET